MLYRKGYATVIELLDRAGKPDRPKPHAMLRETTHPYEVLVWMDASTAALPDIQMRVEVSETIL